MTSPEAGMRGATRKSMTRDAVPELDLQEGVRARNARKVPVTRRESNLGFYDVDFGDETDPAGPDLQLEDVPRPAGVLSTIATHSTRFVTGVDDGYEVMHVPVSRFRSGYPEEPMERELPVAPAGCSVAREAIASIPFGVWKRVPAYALFAMFIGNFMRCGGLSLAANFALGTLVVVGAIGLVVTLAQRSP